MIEIMRARDRRNLYNQVGKDKGLTNEHARMLILCWSPRASVHTLFTLQGKGKSGHDLGMVIEKLSARRSNTFRRLLANANWGYIGFMIFMSTVLQMFGMRTFNVMSMDSSAASKRDMRQHGITDDDVDALEVKGQRLIDRHLRSIELRERRVESIVRSGRPPRIGDKSMRWVCSGKSVSMRRMRRQWLGQRSSCFSVFSRKGLAVHLVNPITGKERETQLEVCAAASVYK